MAAAELVDIPTKKAIMNVKVNDLMTRNSQPIMDAWRVVAAVRKDRQIEESLVPNLMHMTLRNLATEEQKTFHEMQEEFHDFVKLVKFESK